ncbi:hypothetical protein HAX54_016751, partial [Datura stramonium]|nr:hypothetical protein [Datura stramonium]
CFNGREVNRVIGVGSQDSATLVQDLRAEKWLYDAALEAEDGLCNAKLVAYSCYFCQASDVHTQESLKEPVRKFAEYVFQIPVSKIGVFENAPATNVRVPEAPIPQPTHAGTLEAEFRGAIQIITQLVVAQSGR